MSLRELPLFNRLLENAVSCGDKTAFVCGDVRVSHRELPEKTNQFARGILSSGLQKGDRVALLLDNSIEYFLLIAAGFRVGTVSVCLNTRTSADEMRMVLEQTKPKMLFFQQKYETHAEVLREMLPEGGIYCADECGIDAVSLESLASPDGTDPGIPATKPDDGVIIIPTAAVGGIPKGALLSQRNLWASAFSHLVHLGGVTVSGLLGAMPLFHIMGLTSVWATSLAGGKTVLVPQFIAEDAVRLIDKEKLSYFGSFPPVLERVLDAAGEADSSLPSLHAVYGLEGPANIERLEKATGASFWTGFGQAETSGFVTFCKAGERPGSAGKSAVLNQVALMNENGDLLAAEEEGEIVVRGETVFREYWNMPDETAYAHRNGWHHTGDIGRFDPEGYLWYVKRKAEKELIKTGGENVYPGEVEAVLCKHPEIEKACVFGVPDQTWGESIKAVCQVREGAHLSTEEIRDFVGNLIAGFKKPRVVEIAGDMPMKDGEVDREAVKSLYG